MQDSARGVLQALGDAVVLVVNRLVDPGEALGGKCLALELFALRAPGRHPPRNYD